MNSEFYIGYHGKAPDSLARWIVGTSSVLLLAAVGLAFVFSLSQDPFGSGRFEFGTTRDYTGWYMSSPVPSLTVGPSGGNPEQTFLLVAQGKHTAINELGDVEDGFVRLEATLIQRDDLAMLEIVPGSAEALMTEKETVKEMEMSGIPVGPFSERIGRAVLRGEIVDSKCFLGVMNPGEKTVHRSCAKLCIEGGIPPILVLTDENGRSDYVLLSTAQGVGDQNDLVDMVLPFVAQPVSVEGELHSYGEIHELRIANGSITLLR